MENLNNYIQEKLKITSNTKINNTLLDRIISLFAIPEAYQNNKLFNGIYNWTIGKLPHNKKIIDEVIPIAYPVIIEEMEKQGIKKEITDEYKTHNCIENCEMCEDEQFNSYNLYSEDKYEIRYNESILIYIDNKIPNYILYLYNGKRFY